jgi:hypothetical protein
VLKLAMKRDFPPIPLLKLATHRDFPSRPFLKLAIHRDLLSLPAPLRSHPNDAQEIDII